MTTIDIATSKKLLEELREATKRPLSPKEIEQQRISFIFSGMPKASGMSKIDIERVLKKAS